MVLWANNIINLYSFYTFSILIDGIDNETDCRVNLKDYPFSDKRVRLKDGIEGINQSKVGHDDDVTQVVLVGYPHGLQCYVMVT